MAKHITVIEDNQNTEEWTLEELSKVKEALKKYD